VNEMMARAAYTALWVVVLPFALARLWWRGRKEPGYRQHWRERFTVALPAAPTQKLIWLHAVSLGETRAAAPLLDELLRLCPEHKVLLTHTTATGRAQGAALAAQHAGRVLQAWLPYDLPWYAQRFFAHFAPELGIVMETEVWPNLLQAAKQQGVKLAMANARLSEKSASGYARWPALTWPAFAAFDAVLAQTAADAQRLTQCGARNTQVMGNVKFDAPLDGALLALGREWRAAYGKPVLLAASTREGEEALLLQAWKAIPVDERAKVKLAMVPRHPQRFDEVAALISNAGFDVQQRSHSPSPQPSPADAGEGVRAEQSSINNDDAIYLGDSLGEMSLYYGMADVAVMGGSILNYGSQNFIEACAAGCPVVLGPSTYNFAQAAADAISVGAALQVISSEQVQESAAPHQAAAPSSSSSASKVSAQVLQAAFELACSPARQAQMHQAALTLAQAHQGASLRQAWALQALLLA
jgi:3-deoxy-D-manno-octulosonic-acid transferase